MRTPPPIRREYVRVDRLWHRPSNDGRQTVCGVHSLFGYGKVDAVQRTFEIPGPACKECRHFDRNGFPKDVPEAMEAGSITVIRMKTIAARQRVVG